MMSAMSPREIFSSPDFYTQRQSDSTHSNTSDVPTPGGEAVETPPFTPGSPLVLGTNTPTDTNDVLTPGYTSLSPVESPHSNREVESEKFAAHEIDSLPTAPCPRDPPATSTRVLRTRASAKKDAAQATKRKMDKHMDTITPAKQSAKKRGKAAVVNGYEDEDDVPTAKKAKKQSSSTAAQSDAKPTPAKRTRKVRSRIPMRAYHVCNTKLTVLTVSDTVQTCGKCLPDNGHFFVSALTRFSCPRLPFRPRLPNAASPISY